MSRASLRVYVSQRCKKGFLFLNQNQNVFTKVITWRLKAFYCVFRQQELEMAECENKCVPEDHNDENIRSPFQPITNETSVVSGAL